MQEERRRWPMGTANTHTPCHRLLYSPEKLVKSKCPRSIEDAVSLEECLDQSTARKWLDGENMYEGEGCKDYAKAKKYLTVKCASNILTVCLKCQNGRFGRFNKRTAFPKTLNLSPHTSETRDRSDIYETKAVVVHVDVLNDSCFTYATSRISRETGIGLKGSARPADFQIQTNEPSKIAKVQAMKVEVGPGRTGRDGVLPHGIGSTSNFCYDHEPSIKKKPKENYQWEWAMLVRKPRQNYSSRQINWAKNPSRKPIAEYCETFWDFGGGFVPYLRELLSVLLKNLPGFFSKEGTKRTISTIKASYTSELGGAATSIDSDLNLHNSAATIECVQLSCHNRIAESREASVTVSGFMLASYLEIMKSELESVILGALRDPKQVVREAVSFACSEMLHKGGKWTYITKACKTDHIEIEARKVESETNLTINMRRRKQMLEAVISSVDCDSLVIDDKLNGCSHSTGNLYYSREHNRCLEALRSNNLSLMNQPCICLIELFPDLKRIVLLDDDVIVQHDVVPSWGLDFNGKITRHFMSVGPKRLVGHDDYGLGCYAN
ncbi:hypothetical protein VNO77_14600 [Canavalia gladiata]|uniref:Hexosyltransferase n=1 Tax=Canavalia gladiata TaxID=3824 RepID=A0AAN9LYA7_CANGL